LDAICKIYEGNKKSEKEKGSEQKKGEDNPTGPTRGPIQPSQPSSHPNRFLSPFLFLFFSFSPLTGGAHLSGSSSTSSRFLSLETDAVIPPFNPHHCLLNSTPRPAYK
jgi:hypothetical protein